MTLFFILISLANIIKLFVAPNPGPMGGMHPGHQAMAHYPRHQMPQGNVQPAQYQPPGQQQPQPNQQHG